VIKAKTSRKVCRMQVASRRLLVWVVVDGWGSCWVGDVEVDRLILGENNVEVQKVSLHPPKPTFKAQRLQ
jgi:hypothetical protein